MNPFTKRDSHSPAAVITYKILTILTWLLAVVVTVYYTLERPHDGQLPRRKIWSQNYHRPTGFTLSYIITSIYWYVGTCSSDRPPVSPASREAS